MSIQTIACEHSAELIEHEMWHL